MPDRPPLVDPSDARAVIGHYDDYPELIVALVRIRHVHTHDAGARLEEGNGSLVVRQAAEAVIVKYLQLRYTLLPYIYSLGKHTYDTGAPFMRALFMDFPQGPERREHRRRVHVRARISRRAGDGAGRAESRTVYLPAGTDWYNFWTNEKIGGGHTVHVSAPIDVIPVFVRAGSICRWARLS